MDTHERFEAVNDDYIKFERVENKRSTRPDLHAFLLLDELETDHRDIICASEHDEFYLDISEETINNLTDGQILELVRCGVIHDGDHDCLTMIT